MNALTNSSRTIDKRISQTNQLGDKKKRLMHRKLKRPKLLLPLHETEVKRCDQDDSFTILRIRFASVEEKVDKKQKQEQVYIRTEGNEEEAPSTLKLPFIRYKKALSPEQQLRNQGYNPDTRLATEVYEDKCKEKKKNFMNKIEVLKHELNHPKTTQRKDQLIKSRIRVKILGEQLKRKRQKDMIKIQQRKGQRLLQSLLVRSNSDTAAAVTL